MRTMKDLKYFQSMPLEVKIGLTKNRIREWVNQHDAYISFSGGKDSTVLLDIVREDYPDMPAVFVDVPAQYPELREFVTSFDNVTILKPKISFAEVCEKYGFPLISKEVALKLSRIYKNPKTSKYIKFFDGSNKGKSKFDCSKYNFMLESKFIVSAQCCVIMKEGPLNNYSKKFSRYPITGQMACESKNRAQKWLQYGCNMFDVKNPISNPMSFWTEQDVLRYIKEKNLPICSVYGSVVEDCDKTDIFPTRSTLTGYEGEIPLKTTGCSRTGCMLCGFGCHCEKSPNRFEMLKETHPEMYKLLDIVKNNGYTMREAIEWINKKGNINIKL